MPVFYFKDNYNFVTLPTFIIYFTFIIFSFSQIIKKENKISSFFLIVSIFYLVIKFTWISEFGNDIPAVSFSILSIYYFFKFIEEEQLKRKNNYFFNNFSFATFAVLINVYWQYVCDLASLLDMETALFHTIFNKWNFLSFASKAVAGFKFLESTKWNETF